MIGVLREVFAVFLPEEEFDSFTELTSGHINDTFLVTTNQQHKYVFQKINKGVFHDVPGLIMNKVKISSHLHHKLSSLNKGGKAAKNIDFFANFWR